MSELPESEYTPEETARVGLVKLRAFRAHAARPELLLPAASLSLGFALILIQPHPLRHPILAYGLMLCVTTALYLYGREISGIFGTETESAAAVPGAPALPALQSGDVLPLTEPPSAAAPDTLQHSAIDMGSLAALEQSVGLPTLLEIVRTYLEHAENLIEALGTVADEGQWPDAVRIAQDIAGAASGLGLSAVTVAARAFAQKAREGAGSHDLRNTAQSIMGEHLRVRGALAQLYPDLAA
jgi:HPt (histidine-containing phosphotransfer) domain-containing protein